MSDVSGALILVVVLKRDRTWACGIWKTRSSNNMVMWSSTTTFSAVWTTSHMPPSIHVITLLDLLCRLPLMCQVPWILLTYLLPLNSIVGRKFLLLWQLASMVMGPPPAYLKQGSHLFRPMLNSHPPYWIWSPIRPLLMSKPHSRAIGSAKCMAVLHMLLLFYIFYSILFIVFCMTRAYREYFFDISRQKIFQ